MKEEFKAAVKYAGIGMTVASLALLGGCGGSSSSGGGTPAATNVTGTVAQGKVSGATVFADHVDGTEANFTLDDSEGTYSTQTDANGLYSFPAPDYDYIIVTEGGTDTATDEPAMQMVAPQGNKNANATKNVTPLTTVVALTPAADQEALKQTIKELGVDSFDVDISQDNAVSPAALAVVQAIQTAVITMSNAVKAANTNTNANTSAGSSNGVLSAVQTEVFRQVAFQMKDASATDLADQTTLTTKLAAASETAATNITTTNTKTKASVTNVGNLTAISAAVSTAVNAVVQQVKDSAGSLSTTERVTETKVITDTVKAAINTAKTTGSATVSGQVTVALPSNTAPTISGTAPAATKGKAYSFVPTARDSDGDRLIFSISGDLPAGLVFNKASGAITGTPTGSGTVSVVITVSDGVLTASKTVSITVAASTTGGGGTGN
jgi:hypothetical protein